MRQGDAKMLDLAMDGFGCNKEPLIEFFFARPPKRVRAVKAAWEGKHDASLIDRLADELSGDFETLVLTMLKGKRVAPDADDDEVDEELAKQQAEALHNGIRPHSTLGHLSQNEFEEESAIDAG